MLQQEVKEAYIVVLTLISAIQNIKDNRLDYKSFVKRFAYHKGLKDEVYLTIYKTFAGYVGTLLAEYDITHPQEDAIKKTIQSLVIGI